MSNPLILGPDGRRLARDVVAEAVQTSAQPCPVCQSGKDKRAASAGFGAPHPVCTKCGHEWPEEEWHG